MSLSLEPEVVVAIHAQGRDAFPNECCGFLLGRLEGERKRALGIVPADNARESGERYHRFLITPEAYRQAERSARAAGLDVLGFYHSHPNAPAQPSTYDLEHAWPWYSYVIVSVGEQGVRQTSSWVLEEDRSRFQSEPLDLAEAA